jgi:DNA mismatch repair protein MutL
MGGKAGTCLVNLAKAEWLRVNGQLATHRGSLKSQPLLVPLSLKLDDELLATANKLEPELKIFGIELKARGSKALMIMGVPQPLRQQNLQQLLPDLLSYAASYVASEQPLDHAQLANWLSDQITQVKSDYTLSEAIQIIADIEQLWQGQLPLEDATFVRSVDFSATIAALEL